MKPVAILLLAFLPMSSTALNITPMCKYKAETVVTAMAYRASHDIDDVIELVREVGEPYSSETRLDAERIVHDVYRQRGGSIKFRLLNNDATIQALIRREVSTCNISQY